MSQVGLRTVEPSKGESAQVGEPCSPSRRLSNKWWESVAFARNVTTKGFLDSTVERKRNLKNFDFRAFCTPYLITD